jgi:hypothetical protein
MPFIANTFELKIHFLSQDGDYALCVEHWQDASGAYASVPFNGALSLLDAWALVFVPDLVPLLSDECLITTISARHVGPLGGATAEKLVQTAGVGGSFISSMTEAFNIRLISNPSNRNGHEYIPGIGADSFKDDEFNDATYGAAMSNYLAARILQLTDANADSWNPVIASKKTSANHIIDHASIRLRKSNLRRRNLPEHSL